MQLQNTVFPEPLVQYERLAMLFDPLSTDKTTRSRMKRAGRLSACTYILQDVMHLCFFRRLAKGYWTF